jgi:hypothetical protein
MMLVDVVLVTVALLVYGKKLHQGSLKFKLSCSCEIKHCSTHNADPPAFAWMRSPPRAAGDAKVY